MKRILFLIFLVPFTLFAQQELGLHFVRGIWQSNQTNPAFFMEKTVSVSLPNPYFNFGNTAFSQKSILTAEGDSFVIDLGAVASNIKRNNYFTSNINADLFALAIRVKNLQFGLSSNVRSTQYLGYSQDLFRFFVLGNGNYIDQKVNFAPDIQFTAYLENALSGAYRYQKDGKDKWSAGVRIKYLIGLADFSTSTEHKEMSIYTDPEFYQLKFTSDYTLQSSMVLTGNDPGNIQFNQDSIRANFKNGGVGFDIGGTYNLNEKISFAASIIDIGSINWKAGTKKYSSKGEYLYDGLHFEDLVEENKEVYFQTIADTLGKTFAFKTLESGPYKTALNTKFYVSGQFKPIEQVRVGALMYGELMRSQLKPMFAISGNYDVGDWFSVGLTSGYRNKRLGNIGLNLMLKGGPAQLFFISDNISGVFAPRGTRNFNLRTGMNLVF